MMRVSEEEIKKDIAAYLQRVEAGETLVVTRSDKAIAEIKPVVKEPASLRPFGLCAGEFVVPDDFDESLPEEIVAEFEGR